MVEFWNMTTIKIPTHVTMTNRMTEKERDLRLGESAMIAIFIPEWTSNAFCLTEVDDALDPITVLEHISVDRGTVDLGAGVGGEGDDTDQSISGQNWATRVTVADTDSTGQGSSADVLVIQGKSMRDHRIAADTLVQDSDLDLLQVGGAWRQDSGSGLSPSGDQDDLTSGRSSSWQISKVNPVVAGERRLGAELWTNYLGM